MLGLCWSAAVVALVCSGQQLVAERAKRPPDKRLARLRASRGSAAILLANLDNHYVLARFCRHFSLQVHKC